MSDPDVRVVEVKPEGSVIGGAIWMMVLSLLLFWLPLLGPLLAGLVGGKKAGGVLNGILAAFLPAIVVGALLFFFGSALTGLPVIGLVAGAGVVVLLSAGIGPLLLGAIIGGLMA
tara:strand:+ start:297 stop:641 length:345 start_codon:yes stop_codon:yes gene_type:complete